MTVVIILVWNPKKWIFFFTLSKAASAFSSQPKNWEVTQEFYRKGDTVNPDNLSKER